MIRDLILRNRSCRRFDEESAIERQTLIELVDLARLSASAANLQPLKYLLSCEPQRNAEIFRHLAWAAYLKDWPGPPPGERPAAYIIILGDTGISKMFGCDHGIAAQSILLGARERGLAGCMIGLIERDELREALAIPLRYEILLVIALGKPREQVVLDEVGPGGDIKYWRDDNGVHHVPKRPLEELILG
ncbi:MAG: nitroreductase [Armatimonadetes bacterium]|nr:nitroreductase [Armatimonadota bacterium]NIM23744.1 nitroreductase [Armatimonadota bacterium]NIN05827.1 nitroreductase [Armatimonadota bacterium]NIO97164.1 nitroreductase [Armatimonadota bacterium]NIT31175.1 nitroreductase [Armatimonadota bacterium]